MRGSVKVQRRSVHSILVMAAGGCGVTVLLGDPDSDAVALRGQEEAYGSRHRGTLPPSAAALRTPHRDRGHTQQLRISHYLENRKSPYLG